MTTDPEIYRKEVAQSKLEPAAREQLRRTAIRMHKRGRTQEAIAQELGVRRP